MPMRTDCKFYESRTYASGEVVRKCRIDLAPEAPWRCPGDCAGYQRRMVDAGWTYGSMSAATQAPEPEPDGRDVAALLDAVEEIVSAATPEILSELRAKQGRGRLGRRKRRR
jgi:hypothetical protein